MTPPESRREQRGISLIETLMVSGIAGLTLSMAAPSFGGFVDRQRLEGAATQLATDLQLARTEAILRNKAVRLSVYPQAAGSCHVLHTGAQADCSCVVGLPAQCNGNAEALKTTHWHLADRVSLSTTAPSLLFDPQLGTATPAGSFTATDPQGRSIRHVVNLMGRVRSCAPAGAVGGYKPC